MSKAVLLLDMPENCAKCTLMIEQCSQLTGKDPDLHNPDSRPSWCPLKPVPVNIND